MAALVATVVGACGTVTGTDPSAPPASPAPTPTSGTVQVTEADANSTVAVRLGEDVEVVLHQPPGWTSWTNVNTSNPAVLAHTVDPRAAAVRGVTLAAFRTLATGTADITASTTLACSPGNACAQLARVLKITIQVS